MKLNLRMKLLLPTFAVIVLCLLSSGWFSYRSARNALQDALQGQMVLAVQGLKERIGDHLQGLEENFSILVEREAVRALFGSSLLEARARVNGILMKLVADYPGQFEFLAIAGGDGRVLASSDAALVGQLDLQSRRYFQNSLAGRTASELVESRVTGKPVLCLSLPVHRDGRVVGVCMGAVRLDYLASHYITPVRIARKGYAYMVDASGRFLAHPDKDRILDGSIADAEWGRRMLSDGNGFQFYDWEGQGKVVAFGTIERTGWILAAGANFEDIFAPVAGIRWVNVLAAVLTMLGVGTVLFVVANSIARAIRKGVRFAEDIMDGDVTRRLALERGDEVGLLAVALDNMADGLERKAQLAERIAVGDLAADISLASERDRLGKALACMTAGLGELMTEVQSASGQIAAGSVQVADSSQSLSQGATESASSLEEISATVTELASQTKQNAENANQANCLTNDARSAADQGNQLMNDLITAMGEINASAENITKIIRVIDGIAFQTNLLALNAAVEAARAGQHGKGFAVVAEEVRNLAASCAKAARETAELIEESNEKTLRGTQVADKTALALKEIVHSSSKVSDLVAEIAAASREQAAGLDQVTQGLGQIEQVTQQATANAEESAAAAQELSGQAEHLRQMLDRFKIKGGERGLKPKEKDGSAVSLLPGVEREAVQKSQVPADESGSETRILLNDRDFGQ